MIKHCNCNFPQQSDEHLHFQFHLGLLQQWPKECDSCKWRTEIILNKIIFSWPSKAKGHGYYRENVKNKFNSFQIVGSVDCWWRISRSFCAVFYRHLSVTRCSDLWNTLDCQCSSWLYKAAYLSEYLERITMDICSY